MTFTDISDALLNGLSLSSILILTALGLSITFGVMKVINMAHGDMMMLGAYTAYAVTNEAFFGLDIYWAIPITFVVVGMVGYLLEVVLVRRLYGRPLDTLLATWGVGLILQQAVSLYLGTDFAAMNLPEELRGSWQLGVMTFPYYRLFIVAIACLCIASVYFWFYRTTFGLQIRAVTQNRSMAGALGISTRRIDALTFAFGTGLAGVAGCIFAQLYKVSTTMGNDYIVYAFMVVILGGMGSLAGTIVGGIIIGMGDSIVAKLIGTSGPDMLRQVDSNMARVTILLVVILFIMARPSGIFAAKGRVYD